MKVLAIRKAVKLFILTLVAAVMVNQSSYAYVAKYKEDYFKLYHTHYQYNPDDYMENIYWLERAIKADFANPYFMTTEPSTKEKNCISETSW